MEPTLIKNEYSNKMKKSELRQIIREELQKLAETPQYEKQPVDEGWKENAMALALTAASMIGGGKKAKGQDILQKSPVAAATVKQTQDTLSVNFNDNFKSGRYTLSAESSKDIVEKLRAIGNFIRNNPNNNIKISIISSESKVPNYDKEPSSSTYNSRLNTGELASKRSASMKYTIQTLLKDLEKNGVDTSKVTFEPAQNLVGGPEWKQGMSPSDSQFVKHQFVKVVISLSDENKVDYSAFAKEGESYFDANDHLTAIVFYRTREAYDRSQSGLVDTGREDVLVRFVDKNGKFIGEDYLLDNSWWNTNKNISSEMTSEFKEKIIKNGKRVKP